MKFFVQMLAFQPEFCKRTVEVPDDEVSDDVMELLDLIFKYGQNEIQPVTGICSVSSGDVIEIQSPIQTHLYLVQTLGFEKLTPEEYNNYRSLNREDRFWFAFKKSH